MTTYCFRFFVTVAFLVLIFSGCQKSPNLKGFDETLWQSDRQGCKGVRLDMIENLSKVKKQLRGLSSNEIAGIMGRPDKNELHKRNQKFFIYNISPSQGCGIEVDKTASVTLSIRFNAMGLANEVLIIQ